MTDNKREIIFDMPAPKYSEFAQYRMVCRFGHSDVIDYVWWGHLEKLVNRKKWPWSKSKDFWVEIDNGWWGKSFNDIESLKSAAEKFYYESIEMKEKIIYDQINLK